MSLSYARKTPREIRNAFSAEWLDISDYSFRPILVRPIFCRSTLIIQAFILRASHYFPFDRCLEHVPRRISSFNFPSGKRMPSCFIRMYELSDFHLKQYPSRLSISPFQIKKIFLRRNNSDTPSIFPRKEISLYFTALKCYKLFFPPCANF